MRLWEHFVQQGGDTSNVYIGLNKSCYMMCNAVLRCLGTRIAAFGDHPKMYPWKLPPLLEAEGGYMKAFVGDEAYRASKKLRSIHHLKEHERKPLREFAVELIEKVANIHNCRTSKEELQVQEPAWGLNSLCHIHPLKRMLHHFSSFDGLLRFHQCLLCAGDKICQTVLEILVPLLRWRSCFQHLPSYIKWAISFSLSQMKASLVTYRWSVDRCTLAALEHQMLHCLSALSIRACLLFCGAIVERSRAVALAIIPRC